ncbi:MAG TPA: symmetrical bis(5'-nucleosyl)-tetraphosphatase [Gammaproteobacteria bacterium]|nr:symmetrical bis(5'-nucleosyl)-tetraphosphatase [Gammaproteobacteria bacterium]
MSTYAIGDIQGCYNELLDLLSVIEFNPQKDVLWFTGDLINRGSQSLEVLRFVKSLGKSAVSILGNHDLHYLAVASQCEQIQKKDTFHDVLAASDAEELFEYVRHLPLIHHDSHLGFTMVHAGLAPQWTLKEALDCSREFEIILRSQHYRDFLLHMYGDTPDERFRLIVNYCTRMRYVDKKGNLDLKYKGPIGGQPHGFYPWFAVETRKTKNDKIIFGHWASLKGKADTKNVYALDTGCCWGNSLTALRLEDEQYFSVNCSQQLREVK